MDDQDNLGTRANQIMQGAGDKVSAAASQASDALTSARDRLPDGEAVRRGLQNPIGIIVGAAAVGFLVGLALPVSDYERQKLRPIADDLVEQANFARDEIMEHGRAAIAETAAAAQETVQQHAKELATTLSNGSRSES